jgi:hypothetical protein
MRTRRFRPCVDFRPGFDLLLPRITPSDITLMVYTNPTPVLAPTATTTTPPAPTPPITTNDPGDPADTSTTTLVGC